VAMSRSVARNARDKMAKHDTHPDIDLQEVTNLAPSVLSAMASTHRQRHMSMQSAHPESFCPYASLGV
jgi:hypothetical protein